jgi:hypothetical protein
MAKDRRYPEAWPRERIELQAQLDGMCIVKCSAGDLMLSLRACAVNRELSEDACSLAAYNAETLERRLVREARAKGAPVEHDLGGDWSLVVTP